MALDFAIVVGARWCMALGLVDGRYGARVAFHVLRTATLPGVLGGSTMKYILGLSLGLCALPVFAASVLPRYYAHEARVDEHGVLAPWHTGQNGQLDERLRIAIEVYKRYPWVGADKAVMAAPDFVYNSHWSITDDGEIQIPPTNDWMCGDLSQRAWSIVKGLTAYYAYSGDPIAFMYITRTVDYVLDYGLTGDGHPWPRFPISTPTLGKVYGKCDPNGRIQLDLCARLGEDVLTAYKLTGNPRYLEAAKHWADIFAAKCNFDPEFPPWNRYVDPSVVGWSDKLTGSVTMILEFLDAMIDSGYTGADGALLRARDAGRAYIRHQLLPDWTKNEVWGRQYWDWDNPVMCGIVSMCGDYLLKYRGAFPNWRNDLRNILTLIFNRNGVDPNSQGDVYHGAWAFPESCTCCGTSLSYNQYTGAPTLIRYGVIAGDERIKEIGRRMMIMATYDSLPNGVVKDGLFGDAVATGEWSNLAHPWPLCQVMEAMAWMPETFGPARENHLVRSTSVVNRITYGDGRIAYQTFDAPPETVDVLRLSFVPAEVRAGGEPLAPRPRLDRNGYRVETLPGGDCILEVRHDTVTDVLITGDDPQAVLPAAALAPTGPWETEATARRSVLVAGAAGASLEAQFTGNQVRLIGDAGPDGGLADVYLDGERQNTVVDAWNPRVRTDHVLYSRGGLENGPHTLRIVARGAGNPLASGTALRIAGVQYSDAHGPAASGAGGGETGAQRMIFGYMARADYADSKGNAWRPGTEFVIRSGYGKDSVAEALWTDRRTMYIGNTDDPELYRYGLHGKEFWVNLTVGPGVYDVTLHFASTPLHPFLERDKDGGYVRFVLDAAVNGEPVVSNMDVAEAAGGTFKAHSVTAKGVSPQHGIIEVRLTGCDGREAVLQALEVVPSTASQ